MRGTLAEHYLLKVSDTTHATVDREVTMCSVQAIRRKVFCKNLFSS